MTNIRFKEDALLLAVSFLLGQSGCQQGAPPFSEEPKITTENRDSTVFIGNHFDQLSAVGLSDSIAISAGFDLDLRVWDLKNGQPKGILASLDQPVTAIAISPKGDSAALGLSDGQVNIWDIAQKAPLHAYRGLDRAITAVAVSPDGLSVAAADHSGTLMVWEVSSGQVLLRSQKHSKTVNQLEFSGDGRRLGSGSDDHTAVIWDMSYPKDIRPIWVLQGHQGWVTSLTFSPKGAWVATYSADHFVRIWNLKDGQLVRKFCGHRSTLAKIQAVNDEWIAIGGGDTPPSPEGPIAQDFSLVYLSIKTGQPGLHHLGHSGPVIALRADRSGNITTASLDESIRTWKNQPQ